MPYDMYCCQYIVLCFIMLYCVVLLPLNKITLRNDVVIDVVAQKAVSHSVSRESGICLTGVGAVL